MAVKLTKIDNLWIPICRPPIADTYLGSIDFFFTDFEGRDYINDIWLMHYSKVLIKRTYSINTVPQ